MSYHGLGTISPAMRWGATTGTAVNTANSQNTSLIPASGSTASTTPQTITTNTVSRTDSNSLIPSGSSLSTSPQRTTLPSSSEDGSSVSVEDADGLVTIRKPDASATQRDTSMNTLQNAAMSVSTYTPFDDRALAIAKREQAARDQRNAAANRLSSILSAGRSTISATPGSSYRNVPPSGNCPVDPDVMLAEMTTKLTQNISSGMCPAEAYMNAATDIPSLHKLDSGAIPESCGDTLLAALSKFKEMHGAMVNQKCEQKGRMVDPRTGTVRDVKVPVSPVQLPSEEEPFYKNPVVVGGGILLLLVAAYAINKSRG